MKITIIAACDQYNLIGTDGKIPWRIPADMKRFKELTEGNAIIMGRGTFDSIGRKPLPNRLNVVISSNAQFGRNRDGAIFVNSHAEALKVCARSFYYHVYIIGGESVYREAIDYADRILLTRIWDAFPPIKDSRYFPQLNLPWKWVGFEWGEDRSHSFLEFVREPACLNP